jgi:hypothetical protein
VDLEQRRPREHPPEAIAQQDLDRSETERPQVNPSHGGVHERQLEWRAYAVADVATGEECKRRRLDAPDGERQSVERRPIEPLDVVDRDDEGPARSESLECVPDRNGESPRIDAPFELLEQKRSLERAAPG